MAWTECRTCSDMNGAGAHRFIPYVTGYEGVPSKPGLEISIPCEAAKPAGELPRDCGFPNKCCDDDNCPPVMRLQKSEACEAVRGHDIVFVSGPGAVPAPKGYFVCKSNIDKIITDVNCEAANSCWPDPQNHVCTCDGKQITCPQCADGPKPYLGAPGSPESYQKVAAELIMKQNKICRGDCQSRMANHNNTPAGFRFKVNPLVLSITGSVTITVEMADGRTLTAPTEPFVRKTTIGGSEISIPLVPICKVQRTLQQPYPNTAPDSANHLDYDGHKDPPNGHLDVGEDLNNNGKLDPGEDKPQLTTGMQDGLYIDTTTDGYRVQVRPMIVEYETRWGFPSFGANKRPAGENGECVKYIFDNYVSISHQEYFGTNLTAGCTLGTICDTNTSYIDSSQWEPGEANNGSFPIVVREAGLNFTLCPGDGKTVSGEISKMGQQLQPMKPFVAIYENMLSEAETWARARYNEFPNWVAEQVGNAFVDGTCRVTYSSTLGAVVKGVARSPNQNQMPMQLNVAPAASNASGASNTSSEFPGVWRPSGGANQLSASARPKLIRDF